MAENVGVCPSCGKNTLKDSVKNQKFVCENNDCDYVEYYGDNYN